MPAPPPPALDTPPPQPQSTPSPDAAAEHPTWPHSTPAAALPSTPTCTSPRLTLLCLMLFETPPRLRTSHLRNPPLTPLQCNRRPSTPSSDASSSRRLAGLDEATKADEGEADVLDVVDTKITVPNKPEEITSWCRNDVEGSSVDVSVIENIRAVEFEDVQIEYDDDTDDDEAYVNDGHVAPLGQEGLDDDHGFFV